MTQVRVVHEQPGARWRAVWFGPLFAAAGALAEYCSGPVHPLLWVIVAACLTGATAIWVAARRSVCTVRLTERELSIGGERLEVTRIRAVDVEAPEHAKVLGQLWAVPKRFTAVPLLLDDESVVLAWARDGERLCAALRSVSH